MFERGPRSLPEYSSVAMSQKPQKPTKSKNNCLVPVAVAIAKVNAPGGDTKAHNTNPFSDDDSDNEECYQKNNTDAKSSSRLILHDSNVIPITILKTSKQDEESLTVKAPTHTKDAVTDFKDSLAQENTIEQIRKLRPNSLYRMQNQAKISTEANMIYHKLRYSPIWLYLSIALHTAQFSVLLPIGYRLMNSINFVVVTAMVILIPCLLLYTRLTVKMKPAINIKERDHFTPDDETDNVPTRATYILMLAVLLEGFSLAIFTASTAGYTPHLDKSGFYTQDTMTLTLRFSSITLLSFHRVLRPANRADPVRTILELEVVSVCWDALDGSTLFQLINTHGINTAAVLSARVLMAFWYVTVGIRMAAMFCNVLPPDTWAYKLVLYQPLELAPQPTVDRTMLGLRLKAFIALSMATADLFAAGLRIYLWSKGLLDIIQQEMCIKNILFLSTVYNAYTTRLSTLLRDWNSRELGFGFQLPNRDVQIKIFKWTFIATYLIQGGLLSAILIVVTRDSLSWIANIITDILLCIIFLVYCGSVHKNKISDKHPWCCIPQDSFIVFPHFMAISLSAVMMINLYVARIPMIYYNHNRMAPHHSGLFYTYDNALLIVNFGVLVIGSFAMFWSISYMVFKKELTASPGNYNAIHDPTIGLVAMSVQIEGALDVLSCTSLMGLATDHLPASMNGATVIFSLLEMVNACQSFGLQALLSGGHDDTPVHLVKWKSFLRFFRAFVDFGAFVLRIFLWAQYDAVSSVFLIKNLYNLLHSVAQVERSKGIEKYPKQTLFTEFVHPSEWYNMSRDEWRKATSESILDQVRSGRAV